MPRLVWSPGSRDDIARLRHFLHLNSPPAARRAIAAIREAAAFLAERPQVGRRVPEFSDEVREWPVSFGASGYLIRYRYRGDTVSIIAIRHFREAGF